MLVSNLKQRIILSNVVAISNYALTFNPPLVYGWLDFWGPPIIHALALIICWQLRMFVLKKQDNNCLTKAAFTSMN